jgi:hypothetical protein
MRRLELFKRRLYRRYPSPGQKTKEVRRTPKSTWTQTKNPKTYRIVKKDPFMEMEFIHVAIARTSFKDSHPVGLIATW